MPRAGPSASQPNNANDLRHEFQQPCVRPCASRATGSNHHTGRCYVERDDRSGGAQASRLLAETNYSYATLLPVVSHRLFYRVTSIDIAGEASAPRLTCPQIPRRHAHRTINSDWRAGLLSRRSASSRSLRTRIRRRFRVLTCHVPNAGPGTFFLPSACSSAVALVCGPHATSLLAESRTLFNKRRADDLPEYVCNVGAQLYLDSTESVP